MKEEVVESCIIEENGAVLEVTGLPACSSINTINLPQFPVPNVSTGSSSSGTGQSSYQLTVSLPTVPVASMQNQSAQVQVQHWRENIFSCFIVKNISFPGSRQRYQSHFIVTATLGSNSFLLTTGNVKMLIDVPVFDDCISGSCESELGVSASSIKSVLRVSTSSAEHNTAGSSCSTRAYSAGWSTHCPAPDQPGQPGAGGRNPGEQWQCHSDQ